MAHPFFSMEQSKVQQVTMPEGQFYFLSKGENWLGLFLNQNVILLNQIYKFSFFIFFIVIIGLLLHLYLGFHPQIAL